MSELYIEDGGNKVQVIELGLIAAKQQAIVGNSARDLILRTAGNIKIQAAGKFYDWNFNTDTISNSSTSTTAIRVATVADMNALTYPGDGYFVYVTGDKALYLSSDNTYTLVYSPSQDNKQYLSYSDSQSLTGTQKLTALTNTGYLINSIGDVVNLSANSVYDKQVVYSLNDAKHYKLVDVTNPTLIDSWKPVYESSASLNLASQYPSQYLNSPTLSDPILSIGSSDFTSGLAIYSNANNVYLQSLATDYLKGYYFLTKNSDGSILTPLSLTGNNVGVGGNIDYAYNFTVNGKSINKGDSVFTGSLSSFGYVPGDIGSGFGLVKDANDKWNLEVDNINIRNKNNDYTTKGLNGTIISNYEILVKESYLIESFNIYIKAAGSGRYSDTSGTQIALSTRPSYVNVIHTPIADLDDDTATQVYETIPLSYTFGDRTSAGVQITATTYNQLDDLSYYTPTGNTTYNGTAFVPGSDLLAINSISVYFVKTTSQNDIVVGDLLYYQAWDDKKLYKSALHVEVVNVTADGYYVYSYDGNPILIGTKFVKIGNLTVSEPIIQLSSTSLASPSLELLTGLNSFNDLYDSYYYEGPNDNIIDDDLIEDIWIAQDITRVKIGNLENITDTDLSLSTLQYGLYSDNAYLKGNFVLNKGIYNSVPVQTSVNNFLMLGTDKQLKQIDLSTKISHWDIAYGWGNHALAGYALQVNTPTKLASGTYVLGDVAPTGTSVTISIGSTLTTTNYMVVTSIVSLGVASQDTAINIVVTAKTNTTFTLFLYEDQSVVQNINIDWYLLAL